LLRCWALYVGLWLLTPIPRFYLFTGSLEVQAGIVIGLALVLTFRALVARPGVGGARPKARGNRPIPLQRFVVCWLFV
jgi:hypothetical protein